MTKTMGNMLKLFKRDHLSDGDDPMMTVKHNEDGLAVLTIEWDCPEPFGPITFGKAAFDEIPAEYTGPLSGYGA